MREIIFRGKRVDNGEWVEGDLFTLHGNDKYIFPIYATDIASSVHPFEHMRRYSKEVIPETVGQYTGLKDKNGKMIFEGDICSYNTPEYRDDGHYYKSKRETGIVTLDYKGVSFGSWQAFTPFGGCVTEYEIIGNVYDNEQV